MEILKGNKRGYYRRTNYLKATSFENLDDPLMKRSINEFWYTRGVQYFKHGYSLYLKDMKSNMRGSIICTNFVHSFKGGTWRFAHLPKLSKFLSTSSFVVRVNLLHPWTFFYCSFVVYFFDLFYLRKLLFSDFLPFKINFVRGQNTVT